MTQSKDLYKKVHSNLNIIVKSQIISKKKLGVLEISQKTNEWILRTSSKNEFVRSFFRGYQKSFRNYLTFSQGFGICGATQNKADKQ